MKRFNYKARDKKGKPVDGVVEASLEREAANIVQKQGLVVLSISEIGPGILGLLSGMTKEKVGYGDVVSFTRQISTMINAGLPITDALLIIRSQTKGSMQKVVSQILSDVEGGKSLSAAFSKHPKVFTPTYIALIKSGEAGGVIDDVFKRLAASLEKDQEFRGSVKGALIYPAIIVIGMVVVSFIMMIFVVPKLTSLYSEFDAELPIITKILISVSNAFVKFWPLFIAFAVGAFFAFRAYRKTKAGRRKTDELAFKIPIFGDLQRQILLTEISRTLSLMVGAGVSILEALNITSEVVNNVVISEAMKDAAVQVEKGFPIAYSFSKHPEAFPFILSQMIAVGEETGKMEDVLQNVSRVFEVESEQKVKGLTAAIEPLIMIVLGIGVAFLVIAIIMPIYNLTSQF